MAQGVPEALRGVVQAGLQVQDSAVHLCGEGRHLKGFRGRELDGFLYGGTAVCERAPLWRQQCGDAGDKTKGCGGLPAAHHDS